MCEMNFEVVNFPVLADENGWMNGFVLAVNGVPSIPFSVHKRDLEKFRTEDELLSFLRRQAEKYVGMFGDGRNPRAAGENVLPLGRS